MAEERLRIYTRISGKAAGEVVVQSLLCAGFLSATCYNDQGSKKRRGCVILVRVSINYFVRTRTKEVVFIKLDRCRSKPKWLDQLKLKIPRITISFPAVLVSVLDSISETQHSFLHLLLYRILLGT